MTFETACSFLKSIAVDEDKLRGSIVGDNKYVAKFTDSNLFDKIYEACVKSNFYGDEPSTCEGNKDTCKIVFTGTDTNFDVILVANSFEKDDYELTIVDAESPDPIEFEEEE